jgi:hypothetical protein
VVPKCCPEGEALGALGLCGPVQEPGYFNEMLEQLTNGSVPALEVRQAECGPGQRYVAGVQELGLEGDRVIATIWNNYEEQMTTSYSCLDTLEQEEGLMAVLCTERWPTQPGEVRLCRRGGAGEEERAKDEEYLRAHLEVLSVGTDMKPSGAWQVAFWQETIILVLFQVEDVELPSLGEDGQQPQASQVFAVTNNGFLVDAEWEEEWYDCIEVTRGSTGERGLVGWTWNRTRVDHDTDIIINTTCAVVSLVCLLVTLIVYSVIPLKNQLHGRIVRINVVTMMLFMIYLITVFHFTHALHPTLCTAFGFFGYFCSIAMLAWMTGTCIQSTVCSYSFVQS